MNSPFLSTHRLLLTPLSPIHIGCGVDYEPTNSVIDADRNFLYSFNLGLVGLLPQERRGLMTAVQNGVIEEINSFYARNIDIFRPWSSNIVPVSGKAVQKYRSMLSPKPQVKGGQKKTAQFAFQRLVFTRSEAGDLPMIPGSSLKGMISTALKERVNQLRSIVSTASLTAKSFSLAVKTHWALRRSIKPSQKSLRISTRIRCACCSRSLSFTAKQRPHGWNRL